ncbi:MAG: alpha/beta hydrolase [Planctomycetota bacterium]
MQPKFLYIPEQEVFSTPAELGLDFENVVFKSSDILNLSGWYIPVNNPKFTVLFCHGNGGNIAHRLDSINIFHNLGLNCFIFDYRGYGDSQGKPDEEGTYADAMAAYNWLVEEKKTPAENIIIFGRSLGGSIAAQLAGKVEARALIVESAFTSYVDMGNEYYPYMPVRWFARFGYKTIDYIRNVHCPVMFIYSRNDEIVPYKFGLELYEAANEPKEFIEIFGGHNDCFIASGEIYTDVWEKWLKLIVDNRVQTSGKRR